MNCSPLIFFGWPSNLLRMQGHHDKNSAASSLPQPNSFYGGSYRSRALEQIFQGSAQNKYNYSDYRNDNKLSKPLIQAMKQSSLPSSNTQAQIIKAVKIIRQLKIEKNKVHPKSRFLIGVCGIPGSGKSTVSQRLKKGLANSVILPMDGFHLRRQELTEEGLIKRGAAFTFDLGKFQQKIKKVKDSLIGESVKFPSFSHQQKDPVEDAIQIKPDTEILIVQGLYVFDHQLKINQNTGSDFWDFRIWVETQLQVAIERVAKRHLESGIEPNYELAFNRANSNDRTNGLYVRKHCFQVDKFVDVSAYDQKRQCGVIIGNGQNCIDDGSQSV